MSTPFTSLARSLRTTATQAPSRATLYPSRIQHLHPRRRSLHALAPLCSPSPPPKSKDRGPASKEDTQTDFSAMDMLSNTPAPTTGIDACQPDGFALNSGVKVVGGTGVLLVAGEAFRWRPWLAGGGKGKKLLNARGQWDVDAACWGVLALVWPKPDLLILGTGPGTVPVSPATRRAVGELGIRLEVQDTRNAAAQFNLLATERGLQQVAAALVPIGWREGE